MADKPIAAGKSSFYLVDANQVFSIINLKEDDTFLDLACGAGNYTMEAAKYIKQSGQIYALDLWEEGLRILAERAQQHDVVNIKTIHSNAGSKILLDENSIDTCLMATVVHDLPIEEREKTFEEISRITKPGGSLNIIEFKKIEKGSGPGPSIEIRMAPNEVEALVAKYGFEKVLVSEVGEFNYLIKFVKALNRVS